MLAWVAFLTLWATDAGTLHIAVLAAYLRFTAFSACCREGRVIGTARPMLEDSVAPVMYPVMPATCTESFIRLLSAVCRLHCWCSRADQ